MAKILLINPSYQAAYGNSKASIVNPFFPTLGLATIAAVARKTGHEVEILDLCWRPYDYNLIKEHFSTEEMVQKTVLLYRKVLN